MLSAKEIRELLVSLDEELRSRDVVGEIGLCGGAVMCLVFKARPATKDVDGIFEPTREMREAVAAVGRRRGIPEDWLNDAAKGFFLSEPPRIAVLDRPNLRVWAPAADYMLAMKCVSCTESAAAPDPARREEGATLLVSTLRAAPIRDRRSRALIGSGVQ